MLASRVSPVRRTSSANSSSSGAAAIRRAFAAWRAPASRSDQERMDAIENVRKRLASTQRQLADRELEMEQVKADYQIDIDRFQHLLDQVELRRKMSNPAANEDP